MQPGVIRVTARERREVEASSARLHLRVQGEAFVLGNAAVRQARAVAELVERLRPHGVADADVLVEGVQTGERGLMRGGSATFLVAIAVDDLARLGDILGVVSDQRQVELQRLAWHYDESATGDELAALALARARTRAAGMAAAIEHRVTGLRAASDSWEMPDASDTSFAKVAPQSMLRASAGAIDLGTTFQNRSEVAVEVSAEFLVEPIA